MAPLFAVLHGAGNGILTIAKGTLPLVLFGPQGYGLRQGWLMLPARVAQALAAFLFGLALVRWRSGALWLSAGLSIMALLALLALKGASTSSTECPPSAPPMDRRAAMYKAAMSCALRPSSSVDVLIEWLYDAAVDARAWDGVAPALAAAFGADSAVFKLHGNSGVHLLELTANLHTDSKDDAWADHWHRNDLWVERTLALNTSGVVTSQQLLPDAEFERSGYYQDWNRRLGVYHMIGSVFPVANSLGGVVGIHRPRAGGSFGARERHRLAKLLPHLQRAMRIRSHLAPSRLVADAQAAAFDRLHTPALVLNAEGRLLHANAQGESLLRESSSLALSAGRVVAVDPHLGFRWRFLVQQAAHAVGGSLLFERAGRPPLTALVAPLRGASQQPDAAVLVLLRDPEHQVPSPDLLCQLFGLTATEARVAAAIAEGEAPEQIARRMAIGVGTVRSHLRQVLIKTGTHRQNELGALIMRSVAMLGETAHPERG